MSSPGEASAPERARAPNRFLRAMGSPVAAVLFGIALPLFCLWEDPVVFQSDFVPAMLGEYRMGSYAMIGLSIAVLAMWLVFGVAPSASYGMLAAGALFAFALGIALLPFSAVFLPLSPFLTALAFLGCALRARDRAGERLLKPAAALGFSAVLMLPFVFQSWTSWEVDRAVLALEAGEQREFERVARRLARIRPVVDGDRLARAWFASDSPELRRDLARLYRHLFAYPVDSSRAVGGPLD